MPRGSSREFRTKMEGAASLLGISGGVANRLTDKTFRHMAAGAYKAQGFSVDGPNVGQIFQSDADLAIAELGLSAFTAQTQAIDYSTPQSTDALRNSTDQAIGIANLWSIGIWFQPVVAISGTQFLFVIRTQGGSNANAILVYHDSSSNRLRFDWGDQSGTPFEITAFNNFYTGLNGVYTHILLVWNGSILTVFKNGVSVGAPDVGVNNPAITMVDGLRSIGVGNLQSATNSSIDGRLAQVQVWDANVATAASFLQSSPSAIDLNVDSGAYIFSGNLAHWWRAGNEASPDLGKDSATAGITTTIDIEVNSVGIVDGDRVADVP